MAEPPASFAPSAAGGAQHATKLLFPAVLLQQSAVLRRRWRLIVTGSEGKRVRDHLQEVPAYVKLVDKVAFTLGLCNILACEYFVVKQPTLFWVWYATVIPCLLATRVAYFFHLKWQYFLLDFCYFCVFCSFLNLFVLWDSVALFKAMFIFTHGPLTWAIVVWRNSLVFHDYDKITSVYIHLLPCLLYYCLRWHGCAAVSASDLLPVSGPPPPPPSSSSSSSSSSSLAANVSGSCPALTPRVPWTDSLGVDDYLLAAAGYVFWQVCYVAKTEVLDRQKLDARPELLTSLRWLSADRKNSFALLVVGLCRRLRVYRPDELPDASSIKTKAVFISAQFLYTLATFAPTYILYRSHLWNVVYLLFIFVSAAFNGASFYIEVFSSAYQKKLKHLEERQSVAEAAAQFSLDMSNNGRGDDQEGKVESKEEPAGDDDEEEEEEEVVDDYILSPKSDT